MTKVTSHIIWEPDFSQGGEGRSFWVDEKISKNTRKNCTGPDERAWYIDLERECWFKHRSVFTMYVKWKAVVETATKYGRDFYLTKNSNLWIFWEHGQCSEFKIQNSCLHAVGMTSVILQGRSKISPNDGAGRSPFLRPLQRQIRYLILIGTQ